MSDYENLLAENEKLRDRCSRFANQLAGQSKGMQAALDEVLAPILAERDELRAKVERVKETFDPGGGDERWDSVCELVRRALDGGSDE